MTCWLVLPDNGQGVDVVWVPMCLCVRLRVCHSRPTDAPLRWGAIGRQLMHTLPNAACTDGILSWQTVAEWLARRAQPCLLQGPPVSDSSRCRHLNKPPWPRRSPQPRHLGLARQARRAHNPRETLRQHRTRPWGRLRGHHAPSWRPAELRGLPSFAGPVLAPCQHTRRTTTGES